MREKRDLVMKKTNGFIFVLASVLLVSCGSSSTRDFTTSGLGGGTTGGSTGGSTSGGTEGNIYNLPLAPEFQAVLTGSTGQQPTVSQSYGTSHLIRVKVTPLSAVNLLNATYKNWVFPYGCLQLKVTVNGIQRQTQILKLANVYQEPNSPCANAPESQILEFSNSASGAAPVNITVSDAVYDNCRGLDPMDYGGTCNPYISGYFYGYPQYTTPSAGMKAVFANHAIAATIAVQTDGTYLE
jgi:hypothetical protein